MDGLAAGCDDFDSAAAKFVDLLDDIGLNG